MGDDFRTQIYSSLSSKETEELLEIWQNGDTTEWDDIVFEVAQEILEERLGYVPPLSLKKQAVQLLRSIDLHFHAGELEKAFTECEYLIQMTPGSAIAYYYRGMIYEQKAQPEQAIANYQVAIRLDAELRDAWKRMLRIEEDIEHEFWDSAAKGHLDLALEYANNDEAKRALEACELARPHMPEIALAHNYLGMVLEASGAVESAIDSYLRAIELNPRFYAARENLANARLRLEEQQFHLASIGALKPEPDAQDLSRQSYEPGTSGVSDGSASVPGWLFMDEDALLLVGWPGHRTRPGRTGYDPLDRDFELAHMQGTIIRLLITRKFRTRNPFYLALMTYVGLIYCLPLFGIAEIFQGRWASIQAILAYSPYWLVGIALLINVILSLKLEKSKEPASRGHTFF